MSVPFLVSDTLRLRVLAGIFFVLLLVSAALSAAENPEQESQAQKAEAWDQIYINMPAKEVEAILGAPIYKKRLYGYEQILYEWKYPGGGIIRFYMEKVRSIYKPKTRAPSAPETKP